LERFLTFFNCSGLLKIFTHIFLHSVYIDHHVLSMCILNIVFNGFA
jgi:hypothetical protein